MCTAWYIISNGILLRKHLVQYIDKTLHSANIFVNVQISYTICRRGKAVGNGKWMKFLWIVNIDRTN